MDVNRVGVAGHSNGAYTAMTVAGAQPKMGPSNTAQNFKYVGTASRPAPLAYLAASVQGENDHGFFRTSASSHSWVSVVSPNAEERPVMTITGYDDCPGATAAVCHDATDPLDPESSLNRVTAFENMQAVSGADDKIQVWVDVADAEHPDFNLKTDTGTYDAQIFDVVEAAGKAWFDAILNSNAGAFTYLRSDKLKTLMPAGAKLPGDSSAVDICRANLVQ
ncbi:MAG: hypothetical protein HXY25_07400 [Alphaproteobacteria bacterium]|nr:hypothetical protein [Alphaproteobacteria bacterium]